MISGGEGERRQAGRLQVGFDGGRDGRFGLERSDNGGRAEIFRQLVETLEKVVLKKTGTG